MATDSNEEGRRRDYSTIIMAIVVPLVVVIVLVGLVALNRRRACLFSHMPFEDEVLMGQEGKQSRQAELESTIQTQHFDDWLADQKEKHAGSQESDALW
ncbi:hypothetical protein NX059_009525 [Plenodomus lindquistii]|nr:hypothetical protein NX059_009525 [Plenodomus lindquistii]